MKDKISIIVPTYNRAQVIARSINSILTQTYENFELLILDDGSTDDTRNVIERFEDERIRYIRLKDNSGASHARNVGIQMATCEYIAFQDSDDVWLPEKLEKQMQKMVHASEKVGLVYCRMNGKGRNGEKVVCPERWIDKEKLEGNILFLLLRENVIGTPTMLFRKKCLEQAGGFNESLKCIEDWELVLRIAEFWEIEFVEDILVEVYQSEHSVSENINGYLEARCYMISKYWKLMAQENVLDGIIRELLILSHKCGFYQETKKLLLKAIKE